MKQIIPAATLADKILGEQKINKDIKYRLLYFCRLIDCDGDTLLYNNMTKELLCLSKEEAEMLSCVETFLAQPELDCFIKKWFLVPENNDDIALNNQLIDVAKLFDRKDFINNFTILPTTDCNARCFYCYENGIKKYHMTKETAREVAEFIIKNAKGEKVNISWFGGEPLYNMEAIDIICQYLGDNKIVFKSSMVSNGYLFDKETIIKAKNLWKVKWIQITLDGTEDIYNRCKNYIYNDKNAYSKVIKNIEDLSNNGIKVAIRVNIDIHNIKNIKALINELEKMFSDNENIGIYTHILYDSSPKPSVTNVYNDVDFTNQYFALQRDLTDKNLSYHSKISNSLRLVSCMADDDRSLVIMPNGDLSKCEHDIEKRIIGSIYNDNWDTALINAWKTRKKNLGICKTCFEYPRCNTLENCVSGHKSEHCNEFYKKGAIDNHINSIKHFYRQHKSEKEQNL